MENESSGLFGFRSRCPPQCGSGRSDQLGVVLIKPNFGCQGKRIRIGFNRLAKYGHLNTNPMVCRFVTRTFPRRGVTVFLFDFPVLSDHTHPVLPSCQGSTV